MDDQNELVKDFLIESFEYLDSLDEDLLEIENQSDDPEVIARIFRAVHTIKGTGGFLNFEKLVSIAHVGEELLDGVRKGRVEPDTEVVGALFELVDALRDVLTSIEETGNDGEKIYAELIETLKSLQEGGGSGGASSSPPAQQAAASTPTPAPPPEPDVEGKDEIVLEFLKQSFEHLEHVEKILADLQPGETDEALLTAALKHTEVIRGTGGFLSFQHLSLLLLSFRNVLNAVKGGKIPFDERAKKLIVNITSGAGQVLSNIEFTGVEGEMTFANLNKSAEALIKGEPDPTPPPKKSSAPKESAPAAEAPTTDKPAKKSEGAASQNKGGDKKSANAPKEKSSLTDNSIRVDVGLLDSLMNLVGELVLTRNQILQFTSTATSSGLATSAQDLNLITTELQEGVMKTRMQTIGTIWRKFPRVVRDLSKVCAKQARVEMEGEDTELDKTIIEAIKDPLTHIIRNSVDHGIEMPEDRIKKGKSAEGRIHLHAFHEGGSVIIEISDDGKGIDSQRVVDKAIKNGVVTQAEAARLTEREMLNLIFMPGLSTAKQVSNISGRGVGMDVVKTYIERIGGTVDIASKVDEGTTIRIKIPLTLAIIPALMVKVANQRFAIPQVNLQELVRLEGEQIDRNIEIVQGTPIYRLRGKLLPLVYLKQEIEAAEQKFNDTEEKHSESPLLLTSESIRANKEEAGDDEGDSAASINIVVLQAEDQIFGLIVDEVIDTEEVVVKPLNKLLKFIPILAGATIMGDGKVALILDVVGIAHKGKVMASDQNLRGKRKQLVNRDHGELVSLLLARISSDRQVAVKLSMISRLEEIQESSIESAGNQPVVQYRGYLMPLIWLSQALGSGRSASQDPEQLLQVIVCEKNGLNVGLIVDEIVDVVDEHVHVQDRPGVISGVTVIQNQVTEILNIQDVLARVDTGLFEKHDTQSADPSMV